jgi:hypothetical protein
MLTRAADADPRVREVSDFLHRHGLALDDLVNVGWEPRFRLNPKSLAAEKCRRVARCWELMARLGVKFVDLEKSTGAAANPDGNRKRQ